MDKESSDYPYTGPQSLMGKPPPMDNPKYNDFDPEILKKSKELEASKARQEAQAATKKAEQAVQVAKRALDAATRAEAAAKTGYYPRFYNPYSQPLHEYNAEPSRVQTFYTYGWPKIMNMLGKDPNTMAKAGFHRIRPSAHVRDAVGCYSCGIVINEWEPQDIPLLKHISEAENDASGENCRWAENMWENFAFETGWMNEMMSKSFELHSKIEEMTRKLTARFIILYFFKNHNSL